MWKIIVALMVTALTQAFLFGFFEVVDVSSDNWYYLPAMGFVTFVWFFGTIGPWAYLDKDEPKDLSNIVPSMRSKNYPG